MRNLKMTKIKILKNQKKKKFINSLKKFLLTLFFKVNDDIKRIGNIAIDEYY